jgi:hypothetical protein
MAANYTTPDGLNETGPICNLVLVLFRSTLLVFTSSLHGNDLMFMSNSAKISH